MRKFKWGIVAALAAILGVSYANVPLVTGPQDPSSLTASLNQLINAFNAFVNAGGGVAGVASFNARTGAVTPASNDYGFSQLSGSATLAQFPTIATNTVLANITGGTAVPTAITATQLTALCNVATTSVKGCVPTLPNDATKYYDGTGNYSVPAGGGGGGVTSITCNGGLSGGTITTSGTCSLNLGNNNTWTASQRGSPQTISISTATFTPNFDTAQNFNITLVHASCPCTLANPSTTPVAGQSGTFIINQSATGSDTVTTWGSDYIYSGGTSLIQLSTGASAIDVMAYYVIDSTHIALYQIGNGYSH